MVDEIKTVVVPEPVVSAVTQTEQSDTQEAVVSQDDTQKIEPEPKESVIKRIGEKIKNFVTGGDKENKEAAVSAESSNVPENFTKAALLAGFTIDDISTFAADYSDEELLDMIPHLAGDSDSDESEQPVQSAKDDVQKPQKDEISQDDESTKKLQARIDALEQRLGEKDRQTEEQKFAGVVHRANQILDDASKEFEILGMTEKLPKFPDGRIVPSSPQVKARNEIWGLAYTLYNGGMGIDDAMKISLNAYKGKNLVADVKRNVIKDLKKNEQRLSAKHSSHESAPKLPDTGVDVIKDVLRKHGREVF